MTSETSNNLRYLRAMHAVQSGVQMEMELDNKNGDTDSATTPKQLRVGVNSALVSQAGLAALLIEKGLFTMAEYEKHMTLAAEQEQVRYEMRLSKALGTEVTLA